MNTSPRQLRISAQIDNSTNQQIAESKNVLHDDALRPVPAIFGKISQWKILTNWCFSSFK